MVLLMLKEELMERTKAYHFFKSEKEIDFNA